MEVLTSYSHTQHPADLQRFATNLCAGAVPALRTTPRCLRSLHDRLGERTRVELVAAYRAGATAASLAATHDLSLRSVKRLVAAAGVRRQLPSVKARAGFTDLLIVTNTQESADYFGGLLTSLNIPGTVVLEP